MLWALQIEPQEEAVRRQLHSFGQGESDALLGVQREQLVLAHCPHHSVSRRITSFHSGACGTGSGGGGNVSAFRFQLPDVVVL